MMNIKELLEESNLEEVVLGKNILKEQEYINFTETKKQKIKELEFQVEKVENVELRKKILKLLNEYEEVEGNRGGYVSQFAFKQGAKMGFAFGMMNEFE